MERALSRELNLAEQEQQQRDLLSLRQQGLQQLLYMQLVQQKIKKENYSLLTKMVRQ